MTRGHSHIRKAWTGGDQLDPGASPDPDMPLLLLLSFSSSPSPSCSSSSFSASCSREHASSCLAGDARRGIRGGAARRARPADDGRVRRRESQTTAYPATARPATACSTRTLFGGSLGVPLFGRLNHARRLYLCLGGAPFGMSAGALRTPCRAY